MKPVLIALGIGATLAGTTTAQAQSVEGLLQRNAAQQTRIASAVAHGAIGMHDAAQLEYRAAAVYRVEARALAVPSPDAAARARVHRAEADLASATARAEKHRSAHAGTALDRMHLRVAALRNAEQQRWIAREFRQGTLTASQVAALESAQAKIARAEFGAAHAGRETLAAAESIQHMQNLQDYAILKDPSLALPAAERA